MVGIWECYKIFMVIYVVGDEHDWMHDASTWYIVIVQDKRKIVVYCTSSWVATPLYEKYSINVSKFELKLKVGQAWSLMFFWVLTDFLDNKRQGNFKQYIKYSQVLLSWTKLHFRCSIRVVYTSERNLFIPGYITHHMTWLLCNSIKISLYTTRDSWVEWVHNFISPPTIGIRWKRLTLMCCYIIGLWGRHQPILS